MSTLEKMTGHTRLHRRGATYSHRCVVPKDILTSYDKVEETFSLKTKDYAQALRLVREAAVKVDRKFDAHRNRLANLQGPQLDMPAYRHVVYPHRKGWPSQLATERMQACSDISFSREVEGLKCHTDELRDQSWT